MKYDYEKLLDAAREKIPKEVSETGRFELPKFDSFVQGNQTLIKNFTEVARTLGRDQDHLMKFVLGAAGTSGELSGPRLTFQGQRNTEFLNSKLEEYINEFVLCRQCNKPDTELRAEEGVMRIKCKACGAKYTVRKI